MKNNLAYFTSEVSSNHSKNLDRCLKFIEVSSKIGCDAVKFQLFKIDQLFSPEVFKSKPEVLKRKEWELPTEFLPDLSEFCKEKNIDFSVTPFYIKAVEELYPFVDFYKIASYELLWDDLIAECAQTKKPLVLSTGMANLEEIKNAVNVFKKNNGSELTLLHCTSSYPTPPDECNLSAIETLRNEFSCKVGWSDHSVNSGVIFRSIFKWNASFIEFHLDLDGQGAEFEAGHCWLPDQISEVISNVKNGFLADGNGLKEPVKSEKSDRNWRADPIDGLRPLKDIRGKFNL